MEANDELLMEFAGLRLSEDKWNAKIVMTARQGLKILEESGYGGSAEAYRARILLILKETDNKDAPAQVAALRAEMTRVVPGQHRLFIDLLHVEMTKRRDSPDRFAAEQTHAVKAANDALTLARRAFGEQHPLTATAYEMQASVTTDEKAVRSMLKALSIWEKIDTPDSLVDRYRRVGSACLDLDSPAYSTYFDKALVQAKKVYGAGSAQLVQVYAAILEDLPDYTDAKLGPYTEVSLRRAIAMVEQTGQAPPGVRRALYTKMKWLLSNKLENERNTVRSNRLRAEQDTFDKKISALPPADPEPSSTDPLKIADQARREWLEGGPDLYRLALDIWAASKPPRSGLVEAMVDMTTRALSKGNVAAARDLLDRASGFVTGENEQVTQAFLHLAKAACLRAEAGRRRGRRTGIAGWFRRP